MLGFGSAQANRYGADEIAVAEEVADHLAVIVEHAWLAREAQELTRLQERARLAHEIHDTIAQSLIGIILQLDLAEHLVRSDATAARREIQDARGQARQTLDEARRSVLALRPVATEPPAPAHCSCSTQPLNMGVIVFVPARLPAASWTTQSPTQKSN